MASRENTAIHIALILLVMTTIAGAVTSFMFSSQAKTKTAEAVDALRKMKDANNENDALHFKVKMLKYLIGDAQVTKTDVENDRSSVLDTQIEDVLAMEAQFLALVKQYGHGLNKETINYRDFPENVLMAVKQRNETNVMHQKRNTALVADKTKIQETATADVSKEKTRADAAVDDLKKERVAFNNGRQGQIADKNNLVKNFTTTRTKMVNENKMLGAQAVAEAKKAATLKITNNALSGEITELRKETFEVPDGRVTGVDQTNKLAYINLGSIDGLRKGVTFAVYPPKAVGITRNREEIKAEIEVIEVMDQRFARCRILSQYSIRDPIAPMDQIHSTAWRPGRQIHFALVGMLDIDGDGDSDRAAVKNLIKSNNGVIDAEIDDTGAKNGRITVKTRYIVKGDMVDKVITSKQYKDFMEEARFNGVQPITVDEFLSYMGWSNQVRTIALGRGSKSKDFRKKRALQTSDQAGKVFRSRQPPKRGKKGAY